MKKETQAYLWDRVYDRGLQWKKESISLPKILKNKKVLELGVGNGKTLRSILKQKPEEVHAVDFSSKAVQSVKSQFKDKNLFFHHLNLLSMPVEDNSFDVIICYYTLNNLDSKERKLAVKEMHRILAKGGSVVFEDFGKGDFRQTVMKKTLEKGTFENKGGITMHFFDVKELKSLFSIFKTAKTQTKSFKAIKSSSSQRSIISGIFSK